MAQSINMLWLNQNMQIENTAHKTPTLIIKSKATFKLARSHYAESK
ncbi:hypothetical protein J689_2942 [Acinetobacter sp. 1179249]|nr:hypothetical protein J689_2942 [Acinetobacter sp. 1179249]